MLNRGPNFTSNTNNVKAPVYQSVFNRFINMIVLEGTFTGKKAEVGLLCDCETSRRFDSSSSSRGLCEMSGWWNLAPAGFHARNASTSRAHCKYQARLAAFSPRPEAAWFRCFILTVLCLAPDSDCYGNSCFFMFSLPSAQARPTPGV